MTRTATMQRPDWIEEEAAEDDLLIKSYGFVS